MLFSTPEQVIQGDALGIDVRLHTTEEAHGLIRAMRLKKAFDEARQIIHKKRLKVGQLVYYRGVKFRIDEIIDDINDCYPDDEDDSGVEEDQEAERLLVSQLVGLVYPKGDRDMCGYVEPDDVYKKRWESII